MEATKRKRMTVSLPAYAIADIKRKAHESNRSASSIVATLVLDGLYYEPNAETLEAIEEARSGVNLPTVDTSSTEAFIKSILQ